MRIDAPKREGGSFSRPARSLAAVWFLLVAFMVRPPVRSEVDVELQTTAVSTNEAATIPPTPAGRQFAEWLQVFNTGDANQIRSFASKHYDEAALRRIPAEERAVMDLILHNITRGVVPYHVDWSTDPEITVLARANLTEERARIHLEVGSDPLHHIKRFSLTLTGRPADVHPPQKLTEAQILDQLETYLDKLVAADDFSGAVLVARDGKPIFEKAYGLANKKSSLPNRLDTKFNIGSMDKMFTGVAIAQLAQLGRLSFDDTIAKHLPDYPNREVADTVTIHQLLTHTSGMVDYFGSGFEQAKGNLISVRDYFPLFVKSHLSSPPGAKWGYSNAGYIVLGAIIEEASGQSYSDYVKEHICKPAGMSNTDFYRIDSDTPNLAVGYTNLGPSSRLELLSRADNTSALPVKGGPAGGGFSTVGDLLKFDVAFRAHKLLDPKFAELVLTGKVERDDEWGGKYAYGFAEDTSNGKRIVGYTAGYPGVNGELDMYLELGYTVAVLSNYDPPSAQRVAYKLREMIPPKQ